MLSNSECLVLADLLSPIFKRGFKAFTATTAQFGRGTWILGAARLGSVSRSPGPFLGKNLCFATNESNLSHK